MVVPPGAYLQNQVLSLRPIHIPSLKSIGQSILELLSENHFIVMPPGSTGGAIWCPSSIPIALSLRPMLIPSLKSVKPCLSYWAEIILLRCHLVLLGGATWCPSSIPIILSLRPIHKLNWKWIGQIVFKKIDIELFPIWPCVKNFLSLNMDKKFKVL